jgi:hypothetical protein
MATDEACMHHQGLSAKLFGVQPEEPLAVSGHSVL